ncbi:hypothetical protein B0T25DRAFT_540107 [Lasiosphaeria hispida]|uniref:Uncharacterized protein n=1 Tax=Lasiosphaeria hispida TaxID=260671 RepID=A0AAJ0HMV3_9PEZI|nr:hypothetical protein B0T25DRAFT_540107 [Lasiosphaeria hispida]
MKTLSWNCSGSMFCWAEAGTLLLLVLSAIVGYSCNGLAMANEVRGVQQIEVMVQDKTGKEREHNDGENELVDGSCLKTPSGSTNAPNPHLGLCMRRCTFT